MSELIFVIKNALEYIEQGTIDDNDQFGHEVVRDLRRIIDEEVCRENHLLLILQNQRAMINFLTHESDQRWHDEDYKGTGTSWEWMFRNFADLREATDAAIKQLKGENDED